MLNKKNSCVFFQSGTTLMEVLVTILLLSIGLLGLASLQAKVQLVMAESFQRAQATLLLSDMSGRINANIPNAGSYVTASPAGTGDSQPTSCTSIAIGAARDLCEWSNALKGAGEKKSSAYVGAVQSGRGCITQVQAANATPGICTPGIYQVTVVWQGMHQTAAPASAISCGVNLYGTDTYRRAITSRIVAGLPDCF